MNTLYLETINFRSTVQVYHFFLGSINFYCILQSRGVLLKKCALRNFVNLIGKHRCCLKARFNKVPGLKPILKNICQRLLLHYTFTTRCYVSVLLYIQHLLPHHHCYQGRRQEFFRAGEVSWNQGASINIDLQHQKEKPRREKVSGFFTWKLLKISL